MKHVFYFLCLLSVLLFLPVGVSAVGNISVSSTPSGATIYLDSIPSGTTPTTIENVAPGVHTLLLQRSGYQEFIESNVQVDDDLKTTVSATLIPTISISGILPASGINSDPIVTTIQGTGFSTSLGSIVLMKSGQTNISATQISPTTTSISCQFPITGKTAGEWTVVATNPDGMSATFSPFTINDAGSTVTLASITPDNGLVNSTITITSLAGTNFLSTASMKLSRTGYNDIPGTAVYSSSTKLTGTFNLNDRVPGPYQVCVANDATNYVCGLSFVIRSDNLANGSAYLQSNPAGASIYLDSVYKGNTIMTVYDLPPGSYKLVLQKSGYRAWTDTLVITPGNKTYEYAALSSTGTEETTATAVPTIWTTAKTTIKYTYKTITSWPTDTPTQASPAEPLVIIGAIGIGIFILRKKY